MCEHNQETKPCYGCIQELQAGRIVFVPNEHSDAYYVTRSIIRGIVWGFLAVTAVTVFVASVIILGAAF